MGQDSGKRVAITGAASGLGRAMALYFARQGWNVALADINDPRGQEAEQAIRALGVQTFYQHVDVRQESSFLQWREAIVQRWGGLDVIINNAGVAAHGPIDECPLDDWNWIVDINLMGVVRGCRVFTSLFKKQGFGHIVNVASMAGLLHAPEMASYNVTKAGVVALSDTLKTELHDDKIKVSVICPAFFTTNLTENTRSPNPHIKKMMERQFSRSRINADDVARAVFRGVRAGKFYILPHKAILLLWYIKRFTPGLYFWILQAVARVQRKKFNQVGAAS